MSINTGFEEYLRSKKIDSDLFKTAEPGMWAEWNKEFALMHPNSFTVQKLNLINPIRRKYQLSATSEDNKPQEPSTPPLVTTPRPGRPVIKPKIS